MNDRDNFPPDVQEDLRDGFFMTDLDDNFQRCKVISKTCFEYAAGTGADRYSEKIDLTDYDESELEEAVSGYYKNLSDLRRLCGDDANQIIAECIFEQGLY